MRIDAHQHFWRLARGDYGWLTPDDHPAIYRDFTPDDLAPLLAAVGVERTILVQAAPSLAETEFLLEVATATPFVAGVVGWTDLEAPNARATIEALSRNPKLLGLRPMLQDLNDDAWILRASITPALDAMKDASLTFDALVKPRHLGNLGKLIDARPDRTFQELSERKPGPAKCAQSVAILRPSASCRGWLRKLVWTGVRMTFVPTSTSYWRPLDRRG